MSWPNLDIGKKLRIFIYFIFHDLVDGWCDRRQYQTPLRCCTAGGNKRTRCDTVRSNHRLWRLTPQTWKEANHLSRLDCSAFFDIVYHCARVLPFLIHKKRDKQCYVSPSARDALTIWFMRVFRRLNAVQLSDFRREKDLAKILVCVVPERYCEFANAVWRHSQCYDVHVHWHTCLLSKVHGLQFTIRSIQIPVGVILLGDDDSARSTRGQFAKPLIATRVLINFRWNAWNTSSSNFCDRFHVSQQNFW